MKPRIIATIILILLILPLVFIGPQQYGYAFLGYLSCFAALLQVFGAESLIWMLIAPLMTIVLMIVFGGLAMATITYLVMVISDCLKSILSYKATRFIPLTFSLCMTIGLTFLALFSTQPPIKMEVVLFVAPIILLLTSAFYAFIVK